jgi:hypothetical protein
MLDISAARAKERAARFATSFDNTATGPAGFEKTRREPPMLTDKQCRKIDQFAALVPKARRSAFRDAVLRRLSGKVGDAAVHSAAVNASAGMIESKVLAANGLVSHKDSGAAWKSKATLGTGR